MRDDQRVAFVGDDELPAGHDWCYVVLDDGRDCFFIKQSAVCPEALSDAWTILGAGRRPRAA
jgi:hypothetical protein